jgi:hypothetical protein
VTTLHATVIETKMVKSFHPEPKCGEGTHNDALKRVTTPASIAAVGAEDLTILDDNMRAWYEKNQREIIACDM